MFIDVVNDVMANAEQALRILLHILLATDTSLSVWTVEIHVEFVDNLVPRIEYVLQSLCVSNRGLSIRTQRSASLEQLFARLQAIASEFVNIVFDKPGLRIRGGKNLREYLGRNTACAIYLANLDSLLRKLLKGAVNRIIFADQCGKRVPNELLQCAIKTRCRRYQHGSENILFRICRYASRFTATIAS